jgi:hypothetical protein
MRGMTYRKFRESQVQYYLTKEGRFSREEVIKKLETFLKDKLGEGQDFFDQYEVTEEK